MNINPTERILRGAGGLFLSSLAFWGPKNKLFLAGLIPVFTGAIGTCPLYSTLNLSTRSEDKNFGDKYFHKYQKGSNQIPDNNQRSVSEIVAGHPIVGVV